MVEHPSHNLKIDGLSAKPIDFFPDNLRFLQAFIPQSVMPTSNKLECWSTTLSSLRQGLASPLNIRLGLKSPARRKHSSLFVSDKESGLTTILNRTAHTRHLCRKTTVINCHRYLMNTGAEKMNNI